MQGILKVILLGVGNHPHTDFCDPEGICGGAEATMQSSPGVQCWSLSHGALGGVGGAGPEQVASHTTRWSTCVPHSPAGADAVPSLGLDAQFSSARPNPGFQRLRSEGQ